MRRYFKIKKTTLRRLRAYLRIHKYRAKLAFSTGRRGERAAARFLERNGYYIWRRNWRFKGGEIDLIAIKNRIVYFIEVKSRKNAFGTSGVSDNLTAEKFKRVQRSLLYFLNQNRPELRRRRIMNWQLDAITVTFKTKRPEIFHLENWQE